MNLGRFERKRESSYSQSAYICEFWNALSNLPFIIIGLLRFYDEQLMIYLLFASIGVGSFIHHAMNPNSSWLVPFKSLFKEPTLIIDYIPIITFSIYLLYCYSTILSLLCYATWFKLYGIFSTYQ